MAKWLLMLLLIASAIFESLGDLSFRYSALESRKFWLWAGVGLYMICTLIWAYTLKHEPISKAITIVNIINLILVILVGFFVFHESASLVNKIGIGLGVASVILMQL